MLDELPKACDHGAKKNAKGWRGAATSRRIYKATPLFCCDRPVSEGRRPRKAAGGFRFRSMDDEPFIGALIGGIQPDPRTDRGKVFQHGRVCYGDHGRSLDMVTLP